MKYVTLAHIFSSCLSFFSKSSHKLLWFSGDVLGTWVSQPSGGSFWCAEGIYVGMSDMLQSVRFITSLLSFHSLHVCLFSLTLFSRLSWIFVVVIFFVRNLLARQKNETYNVSMRKRKSSDEKQKRRLLHNKYLFECFKLSSTRRRRRRRRRARHERSSLAKRENVLRSL